MVAFKVIISSLLLSSRAQAFSLPATGSLNQAITNAESKSLIKREAGIDTMASGVVKFGLGCSVIATIALNPYCAKADEYGREVEAPTLFTGETTMICTKRGPLGACLQTTKRTSENDNDKATKYFKDPADALKEKYNAPQLQKLESANSNIDGNSLIEKLKQQSEDNKDRNEKIIRQKTLQNDLGASFGPLDRQVVILNSDGESYTLLDGAQAMRLKKQGYIKDRRFVTQPAQEILDETLNAPEGEGIGGFVGGIVKGVFGSSE